MPKDISFILDASSFILIPKVIPLNVFEVRVCPNIVFKWIH
jgi:hypothetical protein